MPLTVRLGKRSANYLESLDAPTRKRVKEKLKAIAENPTDLRLSKPLTGDNRRSARVGKYRILLLIEGDVLLVSAIGSRGQVYRDM